MIFKGELSQHGKTIRIVK